MAVVDPHEPLAGMGGQPTPVQRRGRISEQRIAVGKTKVHGATGVPVACTGLEDECEISRFGGNFGQRVSTGLARTPFVTISRSGAALALAAARGLRPMMRSSTSCGSRKDGRGLTRGASRSSAWKKLATEARRVRHSAIAGHRQITFSPARRKRAQHGEPEHDSNPSLPTCHRLLHSRTPELGGNCFQFVLR